MKVINNKKWVSIISHLTIGVLLVVVFTYPLIIRLDSHYPLIDDFLYFDWLLQYNKRAVLTGEILNVDNYFHTNQFFPFPYSLAYGDAMILPSVLIYTPISMLVNNNIISLNLFLLISILLTYLSMLYFSIKILKDDIVSIFSSFIFTFSPLALSRFPAHIEHLQRYFIPPLIFFYFYYLKRPTIKSALFVGFLTLFSIITNIQLSIYLSYFFIASIPLYSLVVSYNSKISLIEAVKKRVVLLSISLICVVPSIFVYSPYLKIIYYERFSRPIHEILWHTASIRSYLEPINQYALSTFNGTYTYFSSLSKDTIDIEKILYIGAFPLLLSLFAISLIIYRAKYKKNINIFIYFLLIVIAVLHSFGPNIDIFNTSISNPFFIIPYHFFPLINAIRTPTRIMLVSIFFVSILAGIGFKYLMNKGKFGKLILIIGIFVTMFEYRPFYSVKQRYLLGKFVNYDLANKKVLFFPFIDQGITTSYLLSQSVIRGYTMVHGQIGTDTKIRESFRKEISALDIFSDKWFTIMKLLTINLVVIDLNESLKYPLLHSAILTRTTNNKNYFSFDHEKKWLVVNIDAFHTNECVSDNLSLLKVKHHVSKHEEFYFIQNSSECHLVALQKNIYFKVINKDKTVSRITLKPFILKGESYRLQVK